MVLPSFLLELAAPHVLEGFEVLIKGAQVIEERWLLILRLFKSLLNFLVSLRNHGRTPVNRLIVTHFRVRTKRPAAFIRGELIKSHDSVCFTARIRLHAFDWCLFNKFEVSKNIIVVLFVAPDRQLYRSG